YINVHEILKRLRVHCVLCALKTNCRFPQPGSHTVLTISLTHTHTHTHTQLCLLSPRAPKGCPLLLGVLEEGQSRMGEMQRLISLRPQACVCLCVCPVSTPIYARVCHCVSFVRIKTD